MKGYPDNGSVQDQFGIYMRPSVALARIGQSLFNETWRDADCECLIAPRNAATEIGAWDRAHRTERLLATMISGGELRAFGEDDEGTLHEMRSDRTSTPWFRIRAFKGEYMVFPDQWASFFVDGPMLEKWLATVSGTRPRKKQTFEWLPVANEAWRFALEHQDLPRTQADLIGHLQEWYFTNHDRNRAPHEKELSQLAKVVIGHLKNRCLSKEDFSEVSSSD